MRKTRMVMAATTFGVALVGALLPVSASSAQGASPVTPSPVTQAEDVSAAQCAKPLAERVGPWACSSGVVPTDAQRKANLLARVKSGELSASAATVAASTAYCNSYGCWTPLDVYSSDFYGGIYYGNGLTTLGKNTITFQVNMAGAGSSSKPFYNYTSRGTKNTVLSGDRLYISPTYPGGNPVNSGGAFRTSPCGSRLAYQNCAWASSVGYQSYENTAHEITIVHEASWTDPSTAYPGTWHFYAKSIVMDLNNSGGYTVSGNRVPATPARTSWTP